MQLWLIFNYLTFRQKWFNIRFFLIVLSKKSEIWWKKVKFLYKFVYLLKIIYSISINKYQFTSTFHIFLKSKNPWENKTQFTQSLCQLCKIYKSRKLTNIFKFLPLFLRKISQQIFENLLRSRPSPYFVKVCNFIKLTPSTKLPRPACLNRRTISLEIFSPKNEKKTCFFSYKGKAKELVIELSVVVLLVRKNGEMLLLCWTDPPSPVSKLHA